MALVLQVSLFLAIITLTDPTDAALPWNSNISHPVLKTADVVSFDPLSLLAILWNPRASASAARLYMQPDKKMFRWPHMMQIGAVLVPVSMLVNHLTRNYHSIHPGVDMCAGNIDDIDVKSSIGSVKPGSDSLFSKLPVSTSDSLLINTLNFKPSVFPTNDMMIVHVEKLSDGDVSQPHPGTLSWKGRIGGKLIFGTELVIGSIIFCGTIFSVLLGDLWAVVLFATYTFHWLASTAISFRQLVIPDPQLKIQPDERIVFAVYGRPSGGLIIFKGSQSTLERWARTKWVFKDNAHNIFIHWIWILTGTAAAFASVACMVNMSGYLQLGFLGMLLYSSAAELWLTVLAHELQTVTFHGTLSAKGVKKNDKRYKSIIQATLGLDKDHRLDELRWIDLGLLPPMIVFQAMVSALDHLNNLDAPKGPGVPNDLAESKVVFDNACKNLQEKDFETRDGIWREIQKVWEQRKKEDSQPVQVHQV
jgi:hypothetical protein